MSKLRFRLGAIERELLDALEDGTVIVSAFLASSMSARKMLADIRRGRRHREQVLRSIESLKRKRLISIQRVGEEERMTLVRGNKQQVLQYNFEKIRLSRKSQWDGKWHIAMFDITEQHGKARRALTWKMRQIGAMALQKSVFVYPFRWSGELDFITEFFHVSPYVRYVEAVSIEGAEELRRHFKI